VATDCPSTQLGKAQIFVDSQSLMFHLLRCSTNALV